MTAYTKRYTVVVRSDLVNVGNQAFNHQSVDGDGAGDQTFTVPLSASGTLPATAYWASGVLRPAQALAIRNRLQALGATAAEVTPVPPSTVPASRRFAVYDDADWPDVEAILSSLGLQRIGGAP